jgi:hypothetical protein
VALFVLFAAAAGAWLITADFLYRQYALFFFGRQDPITSPA